jgi:hypothetical protein
VLKPVPTRETDEIVAVDDPLFLMVTEMFLDCPTTTPPNHSVPGLQLNETPVLAAKSGWELARVNPMQKAIRIDNVCVRWGRWRMKKSF